MSLLGTEWSNQRAKWKAYSDACAKQAISDSRARWLYEHEIPRLEAELAKARKEFQESSWRPQGWDLGD